MKGHFETALSNLWAKLRRKAYRDAFVAAGLKRGIPRQLRILRERRGWSQAQLAQAAGLTQGAVSRAEDPDYGNLTFNNVLRLASGLDVAFVGKFVPFSQLAREFVQMSEDSLDAVPFGAEEAEYATPDLCQAFVKVSRRALEASTLSTNAELGGSGFALGPRYWPSYTISSSPVLSPAQSQS